MPDDVEQQLEKQAEDQQEAEETHEGFVTDDYHKHRVDVQHKRFRDEERGRIKQRDRADAAEKELDELKGKNVEVVIPPVPDKYSDTFDADIATRDEAITRQAEQNAANENAVAQRQAKDDARVAEENKALEKRVADFDSNMVSHGLIPAQVKTAVDAVIANGISTAFQDDLLEDKDGPLMVMYLKANPIETEEIDRMSNSQRVHYLNDEVRAKALLLKPQTSNAPPPPEVLTGGGAPETKEEWEKGAKYE